MSPGLAAALRPAVTSILSDMEKLARDAAQLVRADLTDDEYADWFLTDKIEEGRIVPRYAINDFVLFRVANRWPVGAKWRLDPDDLMTANFSLSDEQARDLVQMAREGLTDGYVSADWFCKTAICWLAWKVERFPDELHIYLQETLFLTPELSRRASVAGKKGSGRKQSDGVDRDRVIRNLVDGLVHRNRTGPNGVSHCRSVAVNALGRKKVNITEDAVRKICERAKRSEREERLWRTMWTKAAVEQEL